MPELITLKAFGMVAEKIGSSELAMENPGSVEALKTQLSERFPELEGIKFSFALNKKLLSRDAQIPQKAEIALLPPFSGG
ncbi:MAG: MoaD/ThiS family protein [Cyclobacteriaceae bacterium]|nr:MoaD/ThiS family protein [Cyclobacteriaceae bacterium]